MKPALFIIAIIASASAIAQQIPVEVRTPRSAPPAAAPPRAPEFSKDDLIGLLRAQTAAIKALSSKLDSLEERLAKIEEKSR